MQSIYGGTFQKYISGMKHCAIDYTANLLLPFFLLKRIFCRSDYLYSFLFCYFKGLFVFIFHCLADERVSRLANILMEFF